eukprot:CAMPEP_0196570810 /NCGR_PEP_ID=MMETSP1081-20130531/990_1 /TAXON_ID=36882 /ORGANISM="Pyramimonas amylifera, Strain CCMP720" /LENGTH=274 /DNA_ID=CAMNT_0041887481 /DNA_START=163 /DNA_END=987 /DNA_ORIENTATION=+
MCRVDKSSTISLESLVDSVDQSAVACLPRSNSLKHRQPSLNKQKDSSFHALKTSSLSDIDMLYKSAEEEMESLFHNSSSLLLSSTLVDISSAESNDATEKNELQVKDTDDYILPCSPCAYPPPQETESTSKYVVQTSYRPTDSSPESPAEEYITGTRLPSSGWFQVCYGCSTITSHSLRMGRKGIDICRKCLYRTAANVQQILLENENSMKLEKEYRQCWKWMACEMNSIAGNCDRSNLPTLQSPISTLTQKKKTFPTDLTLDIMTIVRNQMDV